MAALTTDAVLAAHTINMLLSSTDIAHVLDYDEREVVSVEGSGWDAVEIASRDSITRVLRDQGLWLEPINSALLGVYPL